MMLQLFIKIFFIAFAINILYEVLHSFLYETCLRASPKKYGYLILKGAVFDGFVILVLYLFVVLIFQNYNMFVNYFQCVVFFGAGIIFAYVWEIYSLRKKKWEYSEHMPLVFGAGLTPLVQLAFTGFLSVYLALVH